MSEYSPPNWTEPLSIYNPINFQQTAQSTNGGGGGGSGYLKYPVAQGSQTMKNTLINGSFQVQAGQAVSMGGNIVQSGGTPVNPTDLATKAYVDLNAGTQNLQSVLTAGNTTGNFNIEYADTYGCVFNGTSTEKWVLGVDPNSFTSTASNDLYVAGNAVDNYFRIGNATGGTFSEVMKVGIDGASAKAVAITGTLSATSITDSASSTGTSGQVLTCGGGGTLTWGVGGGGGAGTLDQTLALGNTATGAYANITLTDSSAGGQANPILTLNNTNTTGSVALEVYKNKPVAVVAGDVLFNESIYGKDSAGNKQEYTRISHTIRDGASGGEDGSIEFSAFTAGAVATFIQINGVENEVNVLKNLDMGGFNIKTNTGNLGIDTTSSTGAGAFNVSSKGNITIGSSTSISTTSAGSNTIVASTGGISQTATTGNVSITATAGALNLTAGGTMELVAGAAGGIQTNQLPAVRTILRTGYANAYAQDLDYYPSYVVENTGTTTNISLPYMPFQNLMLVNSGISPTYNWSDVGDVVGNPTAVCKASSGLVWVGISGFLNIYNNLTFTNPPLLSYQLNAGTDINVIYEAQGFMYVGGQFAGIVGQPTAQFSLMRFAGAGTLTPSFDPMFSASGQNGFNGVVNAITHDNNNLYVGGLFTSTFTTAMTLSNLCIIGDPYGVGGNQTYSGDLNMGIEQFSTNGEVNAMFAYNSSGNQYIFVGGNFTQVAGGFQLIPYGAVYLVNWTTTPFSTLGMTGGFNNPISSFAPSVDGASLLFTGSFNFTEGSETMKYGGWADLANPTGTNLKGFNIPTISPSTSRNCININNGNSYNFFITDDRQVWFGTDNNSWEDGGVAFTSGTPTGIMWFGTNPYVAMPTSTYGFRIGISSTSSAIFQLPSEAFKTSGGTFSKASLPEYAAQLFIADITGSYYHAVGTPISTFSN